MELLTFLLQTILISLSGVMVPGAVTAATIAQGTKKPWAGALIAVGHGILEIPLIFLLMLGLYLFFQNPWVKLVIGLVGGAFLLWMGFGLLREIKKPGCDPQKIYTAGPITTGFVLSATNPYFLFWWATVGLNLALGARELGGLALVLFALVHWLCDLVWLSILTLSAYHGANLLSQRNQKWILGFCGIALAGFGIHFIAGALLPLMR
ncbi:MAG TPA: LysE family transporter [Anaerohalosphaeraceae bacterium]|nr:LysE family transporter [Anaerohalosphaeraceae bacterium]